MSARRRHRRSAVLALAVLAAAVAAPLAAPAPAAAQAAARAPCGKTRILWISDSHALGPFGDRLDAWLGERPGADVTTYAMGGSSPSWWFRGNIAEHGFVFDGCAKPLPARRTLRHRRLATPLLPVLLDIPEGTYDREVVLVAQGSNVPGLPTVYEEGAERLVRAIHAKRHRECVWIGPPRMRNRKERLAEEIYAAIRRGIEAAADAGPCRLIDSRPFVEYPKNEGDGVHYPFTRAGVEAGHRWADGVIRELAPLFDPAPLQAAAAPGAASAATGRAAAAPEAGGGS